MECINCRNTDFFEHSSGYLVCTVCFTQAPRFKTLVDETFHSGTPIPLKRKAKYATQKSSKKENADHSKRYLEMTWKDYTSAYKNLMEIMLATLIKNRDLKNEVKDNANAIWERVLAKQEIKEVQPKNRRKRDREHPNKYSKEVKEFDQKVRLEIKKVCGQGRLGRKSDRFADGVSTRNLIIECEKRHIDPKRFESELNLRDKASILIYIYEEMKNSYAETFSKVTECLGFENRLVKTFEELNKEHSTTSKGLYLKAALEVSNILVIIYISLVYTYAESSAFLVSDVVEMVYEGSIPYFTACEDLEIHPKCVSLFRPLHLPSEHWIRGTLILYKEKYEVDALTNFREYEPFVMNLSTSQCKRLGLVSEFSGLAFKLYQRFYSSINTECFVHTLAEVIIAGCIFIVIKLVYGLNDLPYSIEIAKNCQEVFDSLTRERLKQNQDEAAKKVGSFPSLQSLFSFWQDKIDHNSHIFQTSNVTASNIQSYYNHLKNSINYKPSKEFQVNFKAQQTMQRRTFKISSEPKVFSNAYLTDELQHQFTDNPEYPLPCCDFNVQLKKRGDKQYPAEYLMSLHCVAKVAGNLHTKQLHNVVDKLERLIFKRDSFNLSN